MAKHYLKGPSGAKRWHPDYGGCTKSLDLCSTIEDDKGSVYAVEGTLAHEYAAAVLEGDLKALESFKVLFNESPKPDEFFEAVDKYIKFINSLRGHAVVHEAIEVTLVSEDIADFGGTIDYIITYRDEDDVLWTHLVDYKHGAGVPVSAEDNPQLKSYCVLVKNDPGYASPENFRVSICQPRTAGDAVETVEVSLDEIEKFEASIRSLDKREPVFSSGDHCGWCKALSKCPHVYQQAMEVFDLEKLGVSPADESTDEEWVDRWVKVMEAAPAVKKFLDRVPQWLLEEVEQGRTVPGYKAVKSVGNRTWREDDDVIIKRLQRAKLGKKIVTFAKLKSPTQLEKEGYKDVIADWVYRPDRGIKLVPNSDKRDAVELTPVSDDILDPVDLNFLEK